MKNWHALSVPEVTQELGTSSAGLSGGEASARLAQYGPNELKETVGKKPWQMLLEQFTQTMVL
ncbi:MAG: hypothetical protein HC880_16690, partial [Bacteroidia bacterium]|nr:hypothetical protein [Bacteroidia bacterium]